MTEIYSNPLNSIHIPSVSPCQMKSHEAKPYQSKSYRDILPAHEQRQQTPTTFTYKISTGFRRQHCNPPLWFDLHFHDFVVTLVLKAICRPGDLYGIDMVDMENRLQAWSKQLPDVVNQHPDCPHGTTEELCSYFAQIPLESHVCLLSVSVSESTHRTTTLTLE
ncbi:MAG: hypothetical protein ACFBSC_01230 [Microcoleaceae cyanobacterium]